MSETMEALTNPNLQVQSIAEQLTAERVNQAVEASPFYESPELRRGMESYFGDHRELGNTVDGMLSQELPADTETLIEEKQRLQEKLDTSPLAEQIMRVFTDPSLDYPSRYMTTQVAIPALAAMRLERLKSPDDLMLAEAELRLIKSASEVIYAEASIGVTAIGDNERAEVTTRQEAIKQRFIESGLFIQDKNNSNQFTSPNTRHGNNREFFAVDPTETIDRAQQKFWSDTRFAGQMLFHGSTNFDDMYGSGMIATRRVQELTFGTYNTKNRLQDGEHLHAPVIHWSEMYDETGYRYPQGTKNSGTIAVPLGEIIKQAPFARDAEYSTLRLKPESEAEIIPRITITDSIGRIGSGSSDAQGAHGTDRSFYRFSHDVSPDTAIEEAPDGYAIPLSANTVRIALGEEAKSTLNYGIGENMPTHLEIPVENPQNMAHSPEAYEARQAVIREAIVKLQHDSIKKHPDEIVVPVRAGVMEFYVSDGGILAYRPKAAFARRPSLVG